MTADAQQKLDDPKRLAALEATKLLDSAPEEAFDQITKLVCRLLHAPIALVSLVTDDRQFFKSSVGLPEVVAERRQTPLSQSLCQHVVRTSEALIVIDACADSRVAGSGAVTDLGVRAYAGVPLTTSDGHVLGSFCVIDTRPRTWSDEDLDTLRTLGESVRAQIELRIAAKRAEEHAQWAERARRENAALLESTAEGIYGVDDRGCCTFVNPAAAAMLGYEPDDLLRRNMHAVVHHSRPDGSAYPEHECPIYAAMRTGHSMRVEDDVFWRRDGVPLPVDYCSSPLIEGGETCGAVIAFADITDRKRTEAQIRESWEHDRRVAETLQRAILSDVVEDAYPGVSLASRYLPAWQEARIGGDFFDVVALDGGRLALLVGDASGKGLDAAVRTAEAKFALRAFLREGSAPDDALGRLNNLLCSGQRLDSRDDSAFIVLSLAVFDPAAERLTIASAGAEPPLVIHATGASTAIYARGFPLGFLADQEYEEVTMSLAPGDTLLLATDGITEARQGSEFLGHEGMARAAERATPITTPLSVVAQSILDAALHFAGGSLHDDACILLMRREE